MHIVVANAFLKLKPFSQSHRRSTCHVMISCRDSLQHAYEHGIGSVLIVSPTRNRIPERLILMMLRNPLKFVFEIFGSLSITISFLFPVSGTITVHHQRQPSTYVAPNASESATSIAFSNTQLKRRTSWAFANGVRISKRYRAISGDAEGSKLQTN